MAFSALSTPVRYPVIINEKKISKKTLKKTRKKIQVDYAKLVGQRVMTPVRALIKIGTKL